MFPSSIESIAVEKLRHSLSILRVPYWTVSDIIDFIHGEPTEHLPGRTIDDPVVKRALSAFASSSRGQTQGRVFSLLG